MAAWNVSHTLSTYESETLSIFRSKGNQQNLENKTKIMKNLINNEQKEPMKNAEISRDCLIHGR